MSDQNDAPGTSSLNDLGSATTSSSSALNEEPEAPDPAIVDALRHAKERLFVLKLGESMENLVDQRRDVPLQLAPSSSYQRMLVHRCASYYRLCLETDGPNKTIFVSATAQSRIPSVRMVDVVPSDTSSSPAFKIMRRSTTDKPGRKARSGSADVESDGSDAGSFGLSQKKKKNMTIAEREAAYNEARSRIFSSFEDRDEVISANSSTHSLSNPPSVSDKATDATTVEDESKPPDGSALRTGGKGSAKRAGGKDRWNDPPRPSNSDFDPDFDRRSFSYAPVYEQSTPNAYDSPYVMPHPPQPEGGYVPPHYAMYPPHPAYPPPYMTPYHPYYYDYRHYGHPTPLPLQGRDGSSSANGPPSGSPYPMYPAPGMPSWHSPLPPPPQSSNPPAPPVLHQNVPAQLSRVVSQGQQPPQGSQQQQPPIQAPYFNPVAPPFYPLPLSMANFDPAASQLQPQQQLPPQHILPHQQGLVAPPPRASPGTLYPVQDDSRSVGSGTSRLNASSRGSSRSNVREAAGAAVGRARANGGACGASPGPRNPSQLPRNPWSYGSGLAIPMAGGRRSGSSGSRAGSVSSRSGSAGAMTPADETGSIASSETSSSSSRKTFTSNSSRHPLPARPDWVVGLPQRASSDHSRRSSGSSSALQAPSSDFPPLPPSDRNATTTLTNLSDPPITNGVWKPQGPSLGGGPVRQPSGDNEQPRRSHSQPVSGGVTLGVLSSSGGSGHSTIYPNAPPPRTPVTTTTLPPPALSLPPPPHRAYQQHAQQQHMRLSENDAAFKRPAPKSTSLYEPGNHKSPSASPHRNSPTNMGGNIVGGGILDYQPQLTQPTISKSPAEEQNDRIRGEAVANAIFIDKMTSLAVAEAASAAVVSAASSVSGAETNTSAAEDSVARRRQSLSVGALMMSESA